MLLCTCSCWAQNQQGKASFYSKRATGARTASGERVHHDSLTCAHRSYPFGTILKVTNLSNNKSVEVKVTDRGPFHKGRVVDLSWAAAKELGMLSQGIATVKVEVAASPIPFRPKENIELPQIDFEVMDAGYSFIDNWKTIEPEEGQAGLEEPHKTATKEKATVQAKTLHTNQSSTTVHSKFSAAMPNKSVTNEKKAHKPAPTKESKDKKAETESHSWSSVFEKVKNWGSDLF